MENSQLESFFEYVVSVFFNRRMYLTDTQIPFFYGVGTPDVAAYKITNLIKLLQKYGFLENGGSIIDLMSVSVFGFYTELDSEITDDSIVFEVKTRQTTAPQIQKYTETKIFQKAYEVIPVEKEPESYAGLFTIDRQGKIQIFESSKSIEFVESIQNEYFDWIVVYLKMYILANLNTNELENLLKTNSYKLTNNDLIDFAKTIDFEKLLVSIKSIIEGRKS